MNKFFYAIGITVLAWILFTGCTFTKRIIDLGFPLPNVSWDSVVANNVPEAEYSEPAWTEVHLGKILSKEEYEKLLPREIPATEKYSVEVTAVRFLDENGEDYDGAMVVSNDGFSSVVYPRSTLGSTGIAFRQGDLTEDPNGDK